LLARVDKYVDVKSGAIMCHHFKIFQAFWTILLVYDSMIMWDSLWVTDSQAEMVSAPPPTPKPFAEQARPPPVAADPAPADDDDAKFVTPWKVIFAFSCF
jgi:hypothetical protein